MTQCLHTDENLEKHYRRVTNEGLFLLEHRKKMYELVCAKLISVLTSRPSLRIVFIRDSFSSFYDVLHTQILSVQTLLFPIS